MMRSKCGWVLRGFSVVEVDTEFLQRYRILKVTVRDMVVYEEEIAGKVQKM